MNGQQNVAHLMQWNVIQLFKEKAILKCEGKHMELDTIILAEVNQTQKDETADFCLTCCQL